MGKSKSKQPVTKKSKKINKTRKKNTKKKELKETSDKFIGVTREGVIKTTKKSINKNITNFIIPGMTYSGATLVDILITKYMRAIDLLDAQTDDFEEVLREELSQEEKIKRRGFYYNLISFKDNKKEGGAVTIGGIVGGASQLTSEAKDQRAEDAVDAAKDAGEDAADAADAAKDAGEDAADAAKDAAEAIEDAGEDAAEAIEEAIEDAGEDLGESVSEIVKESSYQVFSGMSEIKELVFNIIPEFLGPAAYLSITGVAAGVGAGAIIPVTKYIGSQAFGDDPPGCKKVTLNQTLQHVILVGGIPLMIGPWGVPFGLTYATAAGTVLVGNAIRKALFSKGYRNLRETALKWSQYLKQVSAPLYSKKAEMKDVWRLSFLIISFINAVRHSIDETNIFWVGGSKEACVNILINHINNKSIFKTSGKKYIIAVCVQILDEKNNPKDVVPDELKYAHVKDRREQFFDTCTYILDNLDKNLHLKDKK
tara:strand:+ start:4307 stop:5752 length:1446 start_codon:yes stop_codon:yes gene_type:complete